MANSYGMRELGRLGQRRWGGAFYEEFLPELRGRRGMEAYREMLDNDDIIGAIMYAIELLIRQVDWDVAPGGPTEADRAAADFVRECMDDMSDTWTDTVSEILSFLPYGWSAHEVVYKRRCGISRNPQTNSKYTDGLVAWQKLPIRAQETLYQWEYDGNDNLTALIQMPPPDYEFITIPAEKLLFFRTKSRKGNPEGRSILRNAYRDWYFKRRIQEIEGIGVERDLAGFPTLTAPEGMNIWDTDDPDMNIIRARAEAIVTNIRRDSLEGIVMPFGWKLELLSTGGRRQFDTNAIIERYDTRIAMTVLADFVLLGHQDVGSFALSSNKTHMFAMAICSYLDIICEVFNSKAIPQLLAMNGDHFAGVTDFPTLTHGDVEDTDIGPLGDFLSKMTAAGLIVPDEEIEDYLREVSGLPERLSDYSMIPGADRNPDRTPDKKSRQQGDKKMGTLDDENNEVTPDDPEAVEKAKAALWRD